MASLLRAARHVVRRPRGRFAAVCLLVIVLGAPGDALAVVRGKSVSITAAPWSVVVREFGQMTCTGVIINARQILTAEHCVMQGETATPELASVFTIEAGVSNFDHPLKSGDPQTRDVSVERLMPGYIAADRRTDRNLIASAAHDLAVLTLSRPLDLSSHDVRAAALPTHTPQPSLGTRAVMAGYGDEKDGTQPNGTLNQSGKQTVLLCHTGRVVCTFSGVGLCFGDSGAGLVEPGSNPTV
jgi:hypothetical protein